MEKLLTINIKLTRQTKKFSPKNSKKRRSENNAEDTFLARNVYTGERSLRTA